MKSRVDILKEIERRKERIGGYTYTTYSSLRYDKSAIKILLWVLSDDKKLGEVEKNE